MIDYVTTAAGRFSTLRRNLIFRFAVLAACLLAWMVGFGGLVMPAIRQLGTPGTAIGDVARLLGALIYAGGGILIYRSLVASIESREASELSLDPGARLAMLGFATGFTLFCLVVGLLWLFGSAKLTGFGDTSRLAAALAAALMASVGEELLFRGVLFRILEQALGTLIALLGSALLFGLAHMLNPSATLIGSLIIAVEAGLMLGMAYVATRNIWFPIGIHLAWNFTQGGIFGASGKATASPSLVQTTFAGPDWLTGGMAGTENSIITVTLCIVLVAIFFIAAHRRDRWEATKFRMRVN